MNRFVVVSAAVFLLISVAYLPLLNELYWSTLTSLKPPVRVVADLLVTNGTIFTSDKSLPFADSMAIRNGRILKVGSFTTLKDFVGDGTVEVNLEGKVVVPGLIDSHVHLISGGLQVITHTQMAQVGLRGVSQKEEFCKMVKDAVQSNLLFADWSTLTSLKPPVRVVADLLVTNGTIFTSDKSLPFADSMAIRNGRILKVGSFTTLKDFVGDGTVEVNLKGKVVVPGLIDSHVHLISGGLQMAQVGLRGVSQKEEFCKMVKDAVQSNFVDLTVVVASLSLWFLGPEGSVFSLDTKEGSWILGGGWNNDFWGGELPSASWIDEISPHNPVWLIRMDGHMALANSLTLKIAGVTSLTEDPIGGTIMRLPSGEPTGLLIDSAMELVTSFVKEVSVDERREALVRASEYALTRGVTTVVDLGRYYPGTTDELSWNDFQDVYLWADSTKKMMIRTCLFFPITTWSRLSV
ncbi:hypothetical protein F2Q70_00026729 [Brassica cretica]|uniref:Amidohydrolase 3 domain-containing protein n=1 Tax=Brassica cretica TaxID=69181 RepID=A0A8S9LCB5_BRACR|nr:hypothetical protein F2Q70_00026729 [Brassica cretica]